jgi:hypothetical protein
LDLEFTGSTVPYPDVKSPIPFVFDQGNPNDRMVNERSPAKAAVRTDDTPPREPLKAFKVPNFLTPDTPPTFGVPSIPQSPLNRPPSQKQMDVRRAPQNVPPPKKEDNIFYQPKKRPEHHRDDNRTGNIAPL